ncbi:glycoside hydrolase family 43 protein [Bifidobacterium cuniculi]|uniref:Alpha-L-arabinofuranosidase n=1 Tax=Bifidobacterium cuniculi TaxID=1688 RepID=A0A087AKK2_9BIFI|nr:glycoside hydrolase family 43 protein [Bifidobacterium cuniculi]KFI59302.1 alpha-L-arabinofuranosidase [Bifidobacterium cuniculi]
MSGILNPVLRGMHPDPSWMWDEGHDRVALVNSTFEYVPGLPIHVTDDLAHYRLVGHAVDEAMAHELLLDYVLDSGGLYAPTLRMIHGRYAIACTVARMDDQAARDAGVDRKKLDLFLAAQGNFVLVADDLEGPWEGPYWIAGAEGIDPDLFEDADGIVYWTQTHGAPDPRVEGQGEIWTRPIDPDAWTFVAGSAMTPLWQGYGLDAVWAEGPHLYRMGEWTYLMTAEGGTGCDHGEMVMRAHTPHGLGEALTEAQPGRLFRPDPKNPFLTHRMLGNGEPVQCVGHADLLHHPRLGWWLACLGTRQTPTQWGPALNFLGRETFIAPINWEHEPTPRNVDVDGTPGWPVLSGDVGRLVRHLEADGEGVRILHVRFDRTDTQFLDVEDLLAEAGALTVRGREGMRYHRIQEERCVITVPAEGHLRIRQDDAHRLDLFSGPGYLRWSMHADGRVDEGSVQGNGPWKAIVAGGVVRLHGDGTAKPAAEVDIRALSTEWAGGFVGCTVGIELPA